MDTSIHVVSRRMAYHKTTFERYRLNPEQEARRIEKVRAMWKGKKVSEEVRLKRAGGLKEAYANGSFSTKGVKRVKLGSREGVDHRKCVVWSLRDPVGRVWWFKNLSHFIRTHTELFDPDDVVWKPIRVGYSGLTCRALNGLRNIHRKGGRTRIPGSWRGWTVANSLPEKAQGCADLLDRDKSLVIVT